MEKPKLSDYVIMVTLFASLCSLWYFAYVKPADISRQYIMNCMRDINDMSYDGYQKCVKKMSTR